MTNHTIMRTVTRELTRQFSVDYLHLHILLLVFVLTAYTHSLLYVFGS